MAEHLQLEFHSTLFVAINGLTGRDDPLARSAPNRSRDTSSGKPWGNGALLISPTLEPYSLYWWNSSCGLALLFTYWHPTPSLPKRSRKGSPERLRDRERVHKSTPTQHTIKTAVKVRSLSVRIVPWKHQGNSSSPTGWTNGSTMRFIVIRIEQQLPYIGRK